MSNEPELKPEWIHQQREALRVIRSGGVLIMPKQNMLIRKLDDQTVEIVRSSPDKSFTALTCRILCAAGYKIVDPTVNN